MIFTSEKSKKPRRHGIYKCHCGNEFKAVTPNIKNGHTQSCGCYHKKITSLVNTVHGMRHHKIYKTWAGIIQRCTNPKEIPYKDYGGSGITVCDRWLHSFENFRDDMLPTWEEGLSIDRIDNNGNYEPSNCRWTTRTIQQRNCRVLRSTNTSGYKGVNWHIVNNKFVSRITVNGERFNLGSFDTELEAAKAYDTYVIQNNLEHTINGVLFSSIN